MFAGKPIFLDWHGIAIAARGMPLTIVGAVDDHVPQRGVAFS